MRQFDILANPNLASRDFAPYVVVLQSHHLEPLNTVMVAPLLAGVERPITEIDVLVTFQGRNLVLSVAEAAAITKSRLGEPQGTLSSYEDQIRRALDRLFTGF